MKNIMFLITIISSGFFAPGDSTVGTLEIQVENLRNVKGQLGILIFKDKAGYPDNHDMAFRSFFISDIEQPTIVPISDLPFGEYTVTVMHDENKNGIFDKSVFAVPKEGYGVSNNPEPRTFGPPSYKDGIIQFSPEFSKIQIKMRYNE